MKNLPQTEHKSNRDKPSQKAAPAADHLRGSFLKEHWDVLVVLIAVCFIDSMLPLGTALQFGGDEGYELMKGFLVSKGFKLYQQIWCDQTPLFPMLLSWGFRIWGPTFLVARLIAAGFGLLLFGTFFQLVKQTAGRVAAFFATFLFIASPIILELSVSAMQEVPAFAVALVSALLLFRSCRSRRWPWLIGSGVVMGIALGIKVTAALYVPGVLAQILFGQKRPVKTGLKELALKVFGWLAAMGFTLGLILLLWGSGSMYATVQTQLVAHFEPGLARPEDFPFKLPILLSQVECAAAAVIGIFITLSQKRQQNFLFPTALLLTTFTVHLFHRPWWDYYYLHTAIPMAWLAGYTLSKCAQQVLGSNSSNRSLSNALSKQPLKSVALAVALAFVMVRSELRLEINIKGLQQRERTEASGLLARIRQFAPQTHWIYVQSGMEQYAFAAQLSMPPEIAVVSLKRFWSGQISDADIINTCHQYQPEQLLMNSNLITDAWASFLREYTNAYQEQNFKLYVQK